MTIAKWISAICLASVLLMPAIGLEAQPPTPEQTISKIAGDVYLFRNRFHQSIFILTSEGVIVTDPINVEAAKWLKNEIAKLTDKPVRYVIYSHDHPDHIAGGEAFADTAIFIAHKQARVDILSENRSHTPVPGLTFSDRMSIDLGGAHVELIHVGKNHSDNSLVILIPEHKLLFAVDFIPVEGVAYRTMRDSYPEDWVESLKRVEQLDFETLVPGHGKIGGKAHVRMFREYLEELIAGVHRLLQNGKTVEEIKKEFRLPKYEQWTGYPEWFVENVEAVAQHISRHSLSHP